jgi:hypothetical protein
MDCLETQTLMMIIVMAHILLILIERGRIFYCFKADVSVVRFWHVRKPVSLLSMESALMKAMLHGKWEYQKKEQEHTRESARKAMFYNGIGIAYRCGIKGQH